MTLPGWLYRLIHPKRTKLKHQLKGVLPDEYYQKLCREAHYMLSKETPPKTGKTALQADAELKKEFDDER